VTAASGFGLVCEIEPPTRPDLRHVRHQIGVLSPVARSFLVPDNHVGRPTVSSIAVAHEVAAMGGASIACLNSRDRNLLGFRRDMLTAAAYGVSEFLFVHGDKPAVGGRTGELTVRAMIDEARQMSQEPAFSGTPEFRIGVAAGARPLPAWKRDADFFFCQVSYSNDALLRWRESNDVSGSVFAGVMVLASAGMAQRLAATIPDIHIPDALVAAVSRDPQAGVDAACEQIIQLRSSGAFDGVHLVPVSKYREVALRLERDLAR
jgi:methylenetetrahydrofolate reductase (NADPH)